MSFSYANAGSGPSAGGLGWFNYGNLDLAPGDTVTGLTGTLSDGSTVTFDLSAQNVAGVPRTFTAVPIPTFGGAPLGNIGYTGILGNTALYTNAAGSPSSNQFTLSNIVVLDPLGNPVPNFSVIAADAETTGATEDWMFNTNGTPWTLFTSVGVVNPPILVGLGTPTATITGNPLGSGVDYLLETQNPNQVILRTSTSSGIGRQAAAVAFAITKISVIKNIGDRINSNDQFVLDIAGTPNDQATTAGAANGIQTQVASIYAVPGNTYTINEAMAPGSVSLLSDYTTVVMATNLTPGGSVPPTGSLPINFTPALGDEVEYTILNAAPETFTKSVDKAFAKPGDLLTYTVAINNPNNFALNNVVFTDATPAGTTYANNLIVSAPFIGTDPATGITITTVPADTTVYVTWQVLVDSTGPVTNPIMNIGNVVVPGGTSGNTNPVTTQINFADLTSAGNFTKAVNTDNAEAGDILTYVLSINNTGNAAANNVVVTDVIPAGTTYVAGSVTATSPFTGSPTTQINLTNPIPAGGNVMITFQVKINEGNPVTNPIPNTASVNYSFTVDPAVPNGATDSGDSNTVITNVVNAKIDLTKATDKTIAYIGDVITYNIAVANTGNVPVDNAVITDLIPNGTSLVPGSTTVSAPFTGTPATTINLTNPVLPGETIAISFKVMVNAIPNPNPIVNTATAAFDFTLDPNLPDGASGTSTSNSVTTIVFVNNYTQQINDLIESIALQEAGLAAIANAEGAKIQKFVALPNVTNAQLLCLNKSVQSMTDSMTLLQSILNIKLNDVDCQISGDKC